MRSQSPPVLISISATLSEYVIRILSEAKAEGWFWNWFKISLATVLRTVPIPVETSLVACGRNTPSLETEGSVDAMKILRTIKPATPKDAMAKRVPGDQTHEKRPHRMRTWTATQQTARTCCRGILVGRIVQCAPNLKGDGIPRRPNPSSPLPPLSPCPLKPSAVQTPSAFSVLARHTLD